jgi:3-methyladenine DNA glycosylase AlkD
MTVPEIMAFLEANGSESIKKILVKHGIKEPFFGVKIEYLKTIQKQVKTDYQLANDLYATGNADAMYLAGLIADDAQMTKADLQNWVSRAISQNIIDYTVPWVATGSKYGYELALEWIDSADVNIATAGWSTLANWVSLHPDSELDMASLRKLLQRVVQQIHSASDRVRATMNSFIISLGTYVIGLNEEVIEAAKKIGVVMVDKGGTACKTPDAVEYINKAMSKGTLGKKKKMVKC